MRSPWHRAAGEASTQTGVIQQFTRMSRSALAVQVSLRGGRGETLYPWSDRYRDHVLFKFLFMDTSIATRRERIDEAFLGDDFQTNIGGGGKEARHDRWQHQARGTHRHIQTQCAAWLVAKIGDGIKSGLHFV